MQVVQDGHRINYITAGKGEPLVLIPGHLQAAEDWVRWGYPELLTDHFRLIITDPLGYGYSDKPHTPASYTLTERTKHLDAVLDAEAVDAAHVWGYSLGATIAEAFARLRPHRTRSIVLGGTLPGLKGVDRRNLWEPELGVYRSGDWERIWNEVLPFTSEESKALFASRNDPIACAASLEGSFDAFAAESAMPLPLLCYVGSGEWFWEGARDVAQAAGGRFFPVAGADHPGAFGRADEVVPEVRVFLGA